jgi:hypothetical protein
MKIEKKRKRMKGETESSCVSDKIIAFEKILCGMGDAWGYIKNSQYIALWWMIRHGMYAPIVLLLVVYVPESLTFLTVFFFVVHFYKLARFIFYSYYDNKNVQAKTAEENLSGSNSNVENRASSSNKEDPLDVECM